jgi:hypothetical protein
MNRRSFAQLLVVPLLATACGGQSATTAPTSAPALSTTTSAATVAPTAVASPTVPAVATASRAVATVTRAATAAPATAVASRTASPPAAAATATRAATSAATPSAGTPRAGDPPAVAPLGTVPTGWQIYRGNTRVPFAIAFPPGWTVDDTRASEGRVYFYGPGVSEALEDALWVLIATSGRAEPTANIDVLRSQYFAAELKESHPEAGIDVTRPNQFSGLTFASLGATFDVNYRLCYAYIGLGLRGQVPWRFRLNSLYSDYSANLDSTFGPMIASLNIYNNP